MKTIASILLISSRRGQRFLLALCALLFLPFQTVKAVEEVELFFTDQTDLDWSDAGSGAKTDVSFWRPRYPAGQNFEALCHIGRASYFQNPGMVVAKQLTGNAFANPVSYTLIWNDAGSGASSDGYFWRPVAPAGYRSLGDVVTGSSTPPALNAVVCVRSDLCVEASLGELLWSSAYSGSTTPSNTWQIAASTGGINIGAFATSGSYDQPAGPFYCLKASAVVPLPAPTNAELEQLISQYGPEIRFHPDEPFLPDDPAVILDDSYTTLKRLSIYPVRDVDWDSNKPPGGDNDKYEYDAWKTPVELVNGKTSSSTILDDVQSVFTHPKFNDPHFRYVIDFSRGLLPGNLSRAKAYVRVQPYQGVLTELQFWMFSPYNGAGHSHLQIAALGIDTYLDPTGTMGEHFSDLEEVHVRISKKNVWSPGVTSLVSAVLSRHDGEEEVAGSDPRLSLAIPGGRPIIYPGIRTHANYLSAGTQVYNPTAHTGFVHVELYDVTGDGLVWNLWDPSQHIIVSSAWPNVVTTTPDWFFFGGNWGGYLKNNFTVRIQDGYTHSELFTEYQRAIENGKPGLLRRPLWDVTFPYNANLGVLRTSGGALSPAFDPQITAYTLALPAGVATMTVTPQAADYHARVDVRVNGRPSTYLGFGNQAGMRSGPLALDVGSNTVEITVTPPGPPAPELPTVKTYTLTVTVTAPRISVEQPAGTPLPGGKVVGWGADAYGQTTPPAGLSGIEAVSAGVEHTLALKSDGSLVAWGRNDFGQATVPAAAQSGVGAISAGSLHSIALKNDGTVVAWGDNSAGQTTVPVAAQTGVTAIAAGRAHSVSLKSDGTVVAWGENTYGQTTPPAGLNGVLAVSAGSRHTVALKVDGSVVAWGDNGLGQTNVPTSALSGVVAIAAGAYHTLALKYDGTVVAWGYNGNGQTSVPAAQQFNTAIAIAAGGNHSMVLNRTGSIGFVLAWGSNSQGQTSVPSGLSAVSGDGIAIAAGGDRSLAVVRSTPAVDFGNQINTGAQSTLKTFTIKNTGNAPLTDVFPTVNGDGFSMEPPLLLGATIAVGGTASFTVSFTPLPADGAGPRSTILNISSNDPQGDVKIPLTGTAIAPMVPEIAVEAPLGTPLNNLSVWGHYTQDVAHPILLPPGLNSLTAIAGGGDHCLGLQSDGTVVAWGNNFSGQLNVPAGLSGVIAIAAAANQSVALTSTGMVVAWGANDYGEVTVPAEALSGVTAIAAGNYFTVALTNSGKVLVWGDNYFGQTTVPAAALSGVTAIAAGNGHVVALKNNGTVVAWGDNENGEVTGVATPSPYSAIANPVTLGGSVLTGVTAIAAGGFHTLALRSDNTIAAWGNNHYGQVAGGIASSFYPYDTFMNPVKIYPDSTALRAQAIAAGLYHSVSLRTDNGTITAWGRNTQGQTTVPAGLSATGIAAGENFTLALRQPSGVSFGNQNTNTTSAPQTITIKNPGSAPLLVTSVALAAQGNPGDFAVNTAGMLGSVPIGGQTTFTVSFTPTALGLRTATVRVLTNDANQGSFEFPVSGTGIGAATPKIAIDLPLGTPPLGGVVAWGWNVNGQSTVPAGALSGVSAIAAGNTHTVALKSDGSVLAWGDNSQGQTSVPAAVSGVSAIAAGGAHTVALLKSGTVLAWGSNSDGQTAVPAQALSAVSAIAAGGYHTVALKSGTVLAWGRNVEGETTVPAAALNGVGAIAAGYYHTVALKSDGSVLAWGDNSQGQTTVPAAALSGVIAIAAGTYHTVALKSDGSVVAWGYNAYGQTTVPATALSGVSAIAAGVYHTLALKRDGTVVAWGLNNVGQTTLPPGLSGVIAIAGGGYHTVALVQEPAFTFGNQLTATRSVTQTFTIRNTGTGPLHITSISTTGGNSGDFTVDTTGMLTSIPAGGQTTFIVTFTPTAPGTSTTTLRVLSDDPNQGISDILLTGTGVGLPEIVIELPPGTPVDGNVVAWGNDDYGQVTVGGNQSEVSAVAAGGFDTVLLYSDGTIAVWGDATGDANYGETNAPPGLSGVVAVAAGAFHSVALRNDGSVVAWGYNGFGETDVPAGLYGVAAIAAGSLHTVAAKTDGTVVAWGYNGQGQAAVPAGLNGVAALAAGYYHTVALKTDGTVVAWGYNGYGQTDVPAGLSGVVAIAAGAFHTVALRNDGTVVAWGYDLYGATDLPAGLSGVSKIAAAGFFTVAVKSDGTVVAWGDDSSGQTDIPAGLNRVIAIAAGPTHTVAVVGTPGVAFGNQLIGSTSAAKTITIKNIGGGPLSITGVSALGENSADFIVITPPMPTSIPAGSQTTFTVAFQPTVSGFRTATLQVLSDDANEGTSTIRLTGTGVAVAGPKIVLDLPAGAPPVGNVVAWGNNDSGVTNVPDGLGPVLGIAAGYSHSAALTTDGKVVAWGDNSYGQTNVPVGLKNVIAISAGHFHTAALKSDGTVVSWGYATEGTVPAGLNGVRAIAAGFAFTLALKDDGSVVAWGYDGNGQTDVPLAARNGVIAIAANYTHALALKVGGEVVAWGANDAGQSTVPEAALSGVTAIAAGPQHSLAVKDGLLLAWGNNADGETNVPAGLSGVVAAAGGDYNTVALKSDGTVVPWGYGGLGVNTLPPGLGGVTALSLTGNHVLAMVGTPSVSFGNLLAGTPGTAKTFTIRNTGTASLGITGVSVIGGNSGDFTVNRSFMLSSLLGGGYTTFSVTFNPATPGVRTTTLRVLSNDANQGTTDIILTGRGLTPIENWRQTWFASYENDGDGADLNDYKKDGIVNLTKFAFGLNPTQNSSGQLPTPQPIGGNFVASFPQPPGVSGILYGAEWSTTLLPASWTAIPDTGTSFQHTFSISIGTVPKLFMRLKVASP